eukprot:GHVQ01013011.1.p1 GENE.GHVQ01013011.1~~GHVQ01013011.1.p1  ORF type:complete len:988 (-),score=198.49 GHVQ01013011.1:515-3478(-)
MAFASRGRSPPTVGGGGGYSSPSSSSSTSSSSSSSWQTFGSVWNLIKQHLVTFLIKSLNTKLLYYFINLPSSLQLGGLLDNIRLNDLLFNPVTVNRDLRYYNLPVAMKYGHLEFMDVKLYIAHSQVQVILHGLVIILGPLRYAIENRDLAEQLREMEELEKEERAARQQEAATTTTTGRTGSTVSVTSFLKELSAIATGSGGSTDTDEEKEGFEGFMGWLFRYVPNIRVRLDNVFIRYEDEIIQGDSDPLAVGIKFKRLLIQPEQKKFWRFRWPTPSTTVPSTTASDPIPTPNIQFMDPSSMPLLDKYSTKAASYSHPKTREKPQTQPQLPSAGGSASDHASSSGGGGGRLMFWVKVTDLGVFCDGAVTPPNSSQTPPAYLHLREKIVRRVSVGEQQRQAFQHQPVYQQQLQQQPQNQIPSIQSQQGADTADASKLRRSHSSSSPPTEIANAEQSAAAPSLLVQHSVPSSTASSVVEDDDTQEISTDTHRHGIGQGACHTNIQNPKSVWREGSHDSTGVNKDPGVVGGNSGVASGCTGNVFGVDRCTCCGWPVAHRASCATPSELQATLQNALHNYNAETGGRGGAFCCFHPPDSSGALFVAMSVLEGTAGEHGGVYSAIPIEVMKEYIDNSIQSHCWVICPFSFEAQLGFEASASHNLTAQRTDGIPFRIQCRVLALSHGSGAIPPRHHMPRPSHTEHHHGGPGATTTLVPSASSPQLFDEHNLFTHVHTSAMPTPNGSDVRVSFSPNTPLSPTSPTPSTPNTYQYSSQKPYAPRPGGSSVGGTVTVCLCDCVWKALSSLYSAFLSQQEEEYAVMHAEATVAKQRELLVRGGQIVGVPGPAGRSEEGQAIPEVRGFHVMRDLERIYKVLQEGGELQQMPEWAQNKSFAIYVQRLNWHVFSGGGQEGRTGGIDSKRETMGVMCRRCEFGKAMSGSKGRVPVPLLLHVRGDEVGAEVGLVKSIKIRLAARQTETVDRTTVLYPNCNYF